jgi:hypothetical protein
MPASLTASASARTVAGDFGAPILPVQHFAPAEDRKLMEGERRLLLAVLEDAVRCYLARASARNREQRMRGAEARNWFRPPDGFIQEGLFTFGSVCEFLEIEPKLFLRRLEVLSIRDLPSTHRQSARRSSLARQRQPRRSAIAKAASKLAWQKRLRPQSSTSAAKASASRTDAKPNLLL